MSNSKEVMTANNINPAKATHPGEILKEELAFRCIGQRSLARMLDVSPTIINEVLNGKRQLNSDLALLIGAALDIDAEPLIELQAKYNLYQSKKKPSIQKKIREIRGISSFA